MWKPPYEKSPAATARPNFVSATGCAGSVGSAWWAAPPSTNSSAQITAIAASLAAVSATCTALPSFTPIYCTSETTRIAATASVRTPTSPQPKKAAAYRPSTTAIADKIPVCITVIIPHPQRNPSAGEYMRFRKTYTPPVSGKSHASSAHTSAAHNVSTPETSHTSAAPRWLVASRVTSEGCTKMETPTMIPTTMEAAAARPIVLCRNARWSFELPGSVVWRSFAMGYQAPGDLLITTATRS